MEEWQDRQCDAHTSGLCARLQIMPLYTQQILAPLPSFGLEYYKTLPKAKRTRGLSSAYQNNFFCHIKVLAQILIKFHLQNIDQASTSKSQPNLSISTKLKLQNLNQT